jgi:hypothetical protein
MSKSISRRDFLRLAGVASGSAAAPWPETRQCVGNPLERPAPDFFRWHNANVFLS